MSSPVLLYVVAAAVLIGSPGAVAPKRHRPIRMTATAYCNRGTTDGGIRTRRGIIAADPRLLPLGTTVEIVGLGARPQTYLVSDTGSAVKGRHVDIFMPSCRAARRFGKRLVTVRVLRSNARSALPRPGSPDQRR